MAGESGRGGVSGKGGQEGGVQWGGGLAGETGRVDRKEGGGQWGGGIAGDCLPVQRRVPQLVTNIRRSRLSCRVVSVGGYHVKRSFIIG